MQNLKPLSPCLLPTTVIQTSKCSHCRHHSSSSWLNQPCNSTTSSRTRKIYAIKFLCLPQQQEFIRSRWPYFQTPGLASDLLALNILQSEIWIQNILSHVTSLLCKSWLPRRFQVGTQVTKQPVNICDHVDRFYLTKTGCMELNMLHPSFPKPMNTTVVIITDSTHTDLKATTNWQYHYNYQCPYKLPYKCQNHYHYQCQ